MQGDLRMMKIWARLKAGELEAEGKAAAAKVGAQSDSASLAAARMRVRSLSPYLDEAQRDLFTNKWKFVQGYVGVIFSQKDAIQTVIADTYPGNDPVSLASQDALVTEGNNLLKNAEALSAAATKRSSNEAIAA